MEFKVVHEVEYVAGGRMALSHVARSIGEMVAHLIGEGHATVLVEIVESHQYEGSDAVYKRVVYHTVPVEGSDV